MHSWDKRYSDRVQLLVDILPVLAKEPRFALKGGTAINLFEHDLPRLSVDIDLTWLPAHDFETDVAAISAALEKLADIFRARPLQLQVQTSGKLAASLSRQHPRDLYDIGLLLADGRTGATLWRTFLVYLTCSPKPAWELLAPREPIGFEAIFDTHFKGMTAEPVTAAQLLENRGRLLSWVSSMLDKPSCAFLWSIEDEQPDFGLIDLEGAKALPGVGRKLQNLARRSTAKRQAASGSPSAGADLRTNSFWCVSRICGGLSQIGCDRQTRDECASDSRHHDAQ